MDSSRVGSHGGTRLQIVGGFVEILVFETNVPPCFRLYFTDPESRAISPPRPEDVSIETLRAGGKRQSFAFRRGDGFIESTSEIPEPHEFEVILTARHEGEERKYDTRFSEEAHGHEHAAGGHGHTHGITDPMIVTTGRGLWAIKWSFVALMATASLQLVVVFLSGSVALLADTIHNFGDAATAVPLGIAFLFARRPASRRYTYGFGRVEDLAGVAVVLMILTSAIVAGYTAIDRLLHPHEVTHVLAIVAASIVGFAGNEGVAIFRIRVGREIGSAALVADGLHARTDGWTSLAVLGGAIGVHLGYPKADPLTGLFITAAILLVMWRSVKAVFSRILDGVEPEYLDQLRETAGKVAGVIAVTDVRARWIGHRLRAEVSISVPPEMTVADAHAIALEVNHQLQHHLQFLSGAIVHIDPASAAGEIAHAVESHSHDGLAAHTH